MIYAEDSFFTLGLGAQIGVVGIGIVLAALCFAILWELVEGFGRFSRVLAALVVFYLFVWLSPQVYYMFYFFIQDGLPLQWVIQSPPSPMKIVQLLTFTDRVTLTEHGQGALGWGLILFALFSRRR